MAKRRAVGVVRLVAWMAVGLGGLAPSASLAGSLDRELLHRAPEILALIRRERWTNVGVLKFRIEGAGPGGGGAGPLGLDLAERLEIALLLACEPDEPLGIIRDAGAVASSIRGADHRTPAGRSALFGADYPLAWGRQRVRPDALLTGSVAVGGDLREVSVAIEVVGRDGRPPRRIAAFSAVADPPTLAEFGSSFLLRGAFDGGKTEPAPEDAADSALKVAEAVAPNPLADPGAPVALEVLYDGQAVPPEFRDGRAWLPEPAEGQRIEFALRKTRADPDRYGVVLMVNGFSTVAREKKSPIRCRKWVLGPQTPRIVVRGYQHDDAKAESFRVLSSAESRQTQGRYGPDAGTIQLVAFAEQKAKGRPVGLDDESEDLVAMLRGMPSGARAENLGAMKAQLLGASSPSRGLIIDGGESIGVKVRSVPFASVSSPILSATITYYRR